MCARRIEASISPRQRGLVSIYSGHDLREPPGTRENLLESQCEISGRRLLALRLAGRSVRCTYYRQDNASSSSPFSLRCLFARSSHGDREERKGEKRRGNRANEKKNQRGRKMHFDLCLRGDSCRCLCSPAFENLSTRNHECPLAIAPKCVRQLRSAVVQRAQ